MYLAIVSNPFEEDKVKKFTMLQSAKKFKEDEENNDVFNEVKIYKVVEECE